MKFKADRIIRLSDLDLPRIGARICWSAWRCEFTKDWRRVPGNAPPSRC